MLLDLDYPVCPSTVAADSLSYHLHLGKTLGRYPFTLIRLDQRGVPMWDYSGYRAPNNVGTQYSVILSSWYALANLDLGNKSVFLTQARWLMENVDWLGQAARWLNRYDFSDYGARVKSPWQSSMSQGLAMSVLVRAHHLSSQSGFLECARKAAGLFKLHTQEGGVRFEENGFTYYEMYPVKPYSRVFDGFAFGLLGLYDAYKASGDEEILSIFRDGVRTLEENIEYWDFMGIWTRYGRHRFPCWKFYHKLNYCLARALAQLSGSEILLKRAQAWDVHRLNIAQRVFVKSASALWSRVYAWRKG